MVKGLTSPEPMQLDLMRTWTASRWQTFWKLRWPAAVAFLFTSLKVAIAISLVGAIVAELPTGAQAGLGARLLTGSYHGQTVQIWAALFAAASSPRPWWPDRPRRAVDPACHGRAPMSAPPSRSGRRGDAPRGQPPCGSWPERSWRQPRRPCAPAARPPREFPLPPIVLAAAFIAIGALGRLDLRRIFLIVGLIVLGCVVALVQVHRPDVAGAPGLGFWLRVLSLWLAAWLAVNALAAVELLDPLHQRLLDLVVAVAFGACVLFLWEVATVGFGVPAVLMPGPSAIGAAFAASTHTLWADFVQTFVRAVLIGWAMGCAAGFLIAILADGVPFLRRGLLPWATSWRRCRSSASPPSWSCGSASIGTPRPPSCW